MSEHNHPNQQVGSQYNADAINIHHHHAPQQSAEAAAETARVRQQLEEFKARFAAIGSHTKAAQEASSLLAEAEDLLVHVVGQSRYDALLQHAQEAVGLQEEYVAVRREEKQQDPGASVRSLFSRGYVSRTQKASDKLDESLENLNRRVAGIEFRK